VVEDADEVLFRLDDVLGRLRLPIIETREHFVDFDEAFVRVIERHRSSDDAEHAGEPGPATSAAAAPSEARQ
jgi:hypothetical protein